MIRGVAYQRHGRYNKLDSGCRDPLADENVQDLKLSMPLLKELGVNTLFIYVIDATKSHEQAMRILANAGIYVIACLSSPQSCINRHSPFESYTPTLLHNYFAVVDCMAAYPNTLGVIAANEVINTAASTGGASVIRAVTRDVKRYMTLAAELHGQRVLPVGLSSAKILNFFRDEFKYFTGGDPSEALDFFCFNDYSWIGTSSLAISGYDRTLEWFAEAHVPVFLSEYGAKTSDQTRPFEETLAIYSPKMSQVYSGACVYEFFYGPNRYGLVQKSPDGALEPLQDFQNLKKNLAPSPPPETLVEWASSEFTAARRPDLPPQSRNWNGEAVLPECPLDWADVRSHLEDSDWVHVDQGAAGAMVDSMADLFKDQVDIT
ncbi:glycolipid anchored surface protein [Colletotrichum sublineola]|nr:glycolipid anchored surface protein [Colletotrichum sublineola]